MAVYKNTGKRAKLFAFMRVGSILKQATAVGMMQIGLEHTASSSWTQQQACRAVLDFMAEQDC